MNPALSKNQQNILNKLLKENSGLTADELVVQVGITKTAIKEHLNILLSLGFIQFDDEKGAVGRPRRKYFISETGRETFPRQYSWLSTQMLELLSDSMDKKFISQFMTNLADRVCEGLEGFDFVNEKQSMEKLIALMNELGYQARIASPLKNNKATLEAFNCVYHKVAQAHPGLCQFDIRLIQNATHMNVKLESCIARGGSSCRFCLNSK